VEGKGGGGEVGREVTDKTARHAGRIHLCSLMTQKLGSLLLTYAQPCPILEWYHVHTLDKIHVIRGFFFAKLWFTTNNCRSRAWLHFG
jgi:hypothetical protein